MKTITLQFIILFCLLASAVGGEEEPKSAEDLLAALGETDYQTRRKAVLATHGRTEPELLDRLMEMARTDPHPNIRAFVADALGTHRDERIFPLLVEMVGRESMPGPRQHALAALGCTKNPVARGILKAKLDDENDRAWAARGLGNFGDPKDYPSLDQLFRKHMKDPWVSDLASKAMMKLDPRAAISTFLELFPGLKGSARFTVVNILREQPDERVRESMTRHLDSKDWEIRLAAISVLGRTGNEETAKRLLVLLEEYADQRGVIARALGEIAAPFTARPIAKVLAGEETNVAKVLLMQALANIGDRRAIATLIPFLDDLGTTPQELRISSIHGFPWNLHVKDAALWAILTLRDGEPPCKPEDLSSFPLGSRHARCEREDVPLREWWRENAGDAELNFDD